MGQVVSRFPNCWFYRVDWSAVFFDAWIQPFGPMQPLVWRSIWAAPFGSPLVSLFSRKNGTSSEQDMLSLGGCLLCFALLAGGTDWRPAPPQGVDCNEMQRCVTLVTSRTALIRGVLTLLAQRHVNMFDRNIENKSSTYGKQLRNTSNLIDTIPNNNTVCLARINQCCLFFVVHWLACEYQLSFVCLQFWQTWLQPCVFWHTISFFWMFIPLIQTLALIIVYHNCWWCNMDYHQCGLHYHLHKYQNDSREVGG